MQEDTMINIMIIQKIKKNTKLIIIDNNFTLQHIPFLTYLFKDIIYNNEEKINIIEKINNIMEYKIKIYNKLLVKSSYYVYHDINYEKQNLEKIINGIKNLMKQVKNDITFYTKLEYIITNLINTLTIIKYKL